MRTNRSVLLAIAVAALAAAPALPVTPEAASSRAIALGIVSRHVAASGGEAAANRVQSLAARGSVRIHGLAEPGVVSMQQARPDRLQLAVDVGSLGTFREGHDGMTGWSLVGSSSPSIAEDTELFVLAAEASDFLILSDVEKRFDVIEYQGRISLGGRDLESVRLASNERRCQELRYFDPATGLQAASSIRCGCADDSCEVRTLYSDYRSQGGVMFPMELRRAMGEVQYDMKLETIEPNPARLPSFAPPTQATSTITDVEPASRKRALTTAEVAAPASSEAADPPDSWRDVLYSRGRQYQVQGIEAATVAIAWIPDESSLFVFAHNDGPRNAHFMPESITATGVKGKGEQVAVRVITPDQWERKVQRRIAWSQALSGAAAGFEAGAEATRPGDTISYSEHTNYGFNGTYGTSYYGKSGYAGDSYGTFRGTGTSSTHGTIQLPPDRTAQELAKLRRAQQMQQLNDNLESYHALATGDLARAETVAAGGQTGGRVHLEKTKLSSLSISVPFAGSVFTFSF